MDYPVINMHAHVYPDSLAERAVSALAELYPIPVQCSGTLEELLEEGHRAGISRFVLCSPATKPEQVAAINSFVAQCCREHAECIGFGTLHPWGNNLEAELHHLKAMGLKGVKLHPDAQRFQVDSPAALRMFQAIEKSGLPVLLHMGSTGANRFSSPRQVRALAEAHPDLILIAAHMGGLFSSPEAPELLSGLPNVYFDMSSVFSLVSDDLFLESVRKVGADRIFFGTDYPIWRAEEVLQRFLALPLSEQERRAILFENFDRLMARKGTGHGTDD